MEFKIGQKVNTPAVGVIKYYMGGKTVWVTFNENTAEIEFDIKHLKPYKTAHERLLEIGFTFKGKWTNGGEYDDYRYKLDDLWFLQIFHNSYDLTYYTYDGRSDLELSRILTDYLEELNEK